MKVSTLITLVLAIFAGFNFYAQKNPAPQAVPFSFLSQTNSTLPPGIATHRFGTTATAKPTTRIVTQGNADLPYNTGSNTGGWRSEAENGISMLASGSSAAGALIVALNTTGKTNIQLESTVRTILNQASRDNSIALQYRVGTTGNFTDLGSSTTYNSANTDVLDYNTFREFLPAAAENQPEVQVRWLYWESFSVSGSRECLTEDDIEIGIGCITPASQPTGLILTAGLDSIQGSYSAAARDSTAVSHPLLT